MKIYDRPYLCSYAEVVDEMAGLLHVGIDRTHNEILCLLKTSDNITRYVVDQVGNLLSSNDLYIQKNTLDALSHPDTFEHITTQYNEQIQHMSCQSCHWYIKEKVKHSIHKHQE